MPTNEAVSSSAADALLASYATNHRINEFLIQNLSDAAWRATPPDGKGRDIASIFAHMHNVRLMWLKSAVTDGRIPAKLDGHVFTKQDANRALEESWRVMNDLLRDALATGGRIKGFKPDAYRFLAYLLAHDAHHRGQISMLARQIGHPLSKSANFGMWEWGVR